jgi:SAM-dependent methyltransferase
MKTAARELAKKLAFRYFPALSAPGYGYGLDPAALAFLVIAISERAGTPGCVAEVGVARGMTTRFLAEHMAREGIRKPYHAIDTFAAFVPDDVAYEKTHRGKTTADLAGFTYNDVGAWRRNFQAFDFIVAHACDCKQFQFASIAPISVAVLDVDLYLPTMRTLPAVYDALEPGGVILVDDVTPGSRWDGAHQAYVEFCTARSLPHERIGNKAAALRR